MSLAQTRLGRQGTRSFIEVGILAVVVLGVCCLVVSAAFDAYHEPMLAEHLCECVAARETACIVEHLLQDGMQLRSTQSGVGFAIFTGLLHDDWLYRILGKTIFVRTFVIGLSAVTKQPAKEVPGLPLSRLSEADLLFSARFFSYRDVEGLLCKIQSWSNRHGNGVSPVPAPCEDALSPASFSPLAFVLCLLLSCPRLNLIPAAKVANLFHSGTCPSGKQHRTAADVILLDDLLFGNTAFKVFTDD